MNKLIDKLIISALTLLIFKNPIHAAVENSALGTWTEIERLPAAVQMHTMAVAEGRLYIIGGRESFDWQTARTNVFFARIKEDGSVENWKKTTPLPQAVAGHTTVVYGKRIYVVSGKGHGSDNIMVKPVSYVGTIEDDGGISSWQETSALPDGIAYQGKALLYNRHIYYVGGFYSRLVYRSEILDNGSLGEWMQVQRMVVPKMHFGLAQHEGILHVIGGNRNHYYTSIDTILSAKIQDGGSIESWYRNGVLPEANSAFAIAQAGTTVFTVGGAAGNKVFSSSLAGDGTFTGWHREESFPLSVASGAAAVYKNRIYHSGGRITADEKTYISRSVHTAEILNFERYPLRFKLTDSVVKSSGWLQLGKKYLQTSDSSIVIDAADTTSLDFMTHHEDVIISNSDTTGKGAIRYVKRLENRLLVNKQDTYQVWYRAYFPVRGHWNHIEQMNDGSIVEVDDAFEDSCTPNEWLWHKGPRYDLPVGEHRYLFPSPTAWGGGALLDKIALLTASSRPPSGKGPDYSPVRTSLRGEITSNTFLIEDFSVWKLEYEEDLHGGKIKVEYSYDKGETWNLLSAEKEMPIDKLQKYMILRFTLTAAPNGESPLLRDVNLLLYKQGSG